MTETDTLSGEVQHSPSGVLSRMQSPPVSKATFDVVAQQLVQRLNQRLSSEAGARQVAPSPSDQELTQFCEALVSADRDDSRRFFDRLRDAGATPDTLSLRYFAPAAERLGEYWVADSCSFLEVTLGCARLHALQRNLRSDFAPAFLNPPSALNALFVPLPGDTHVLGIRIAADFFRRAGWHVEFEQPRDIDELSDRAASGDFNVIGLSAGCSTVLPKLHTAVQRLRAVRPDALLVLGGHITELHPDIAQQLDIDQTLTDVSTAPSVLQRQVYQRIKR